MMAIDQSDAPNLAAYMYAARSILVDKDDEVYKDNKVDKDDELDKDDKMDRDDEDSKEEEEDMDQKEKEEENFFFVKILKMTKYTSLPNLVRLAQWEQANVYYY